MIAKLYGVIDMLLEDRVLLQVNGVCYGINCSARTLSELAVGQKAELWIEHIVRPESQTLCGFLKYEEQLCFREVTNVQGVGVKVALSLLSTFSPQEIISHIINKDKDALTRADGVGQKMAERIIIELKNSKLLRGKFATGGMEMVPSYVSDAIDALVALGYEKNKSKAVVLDLAKNFSSPEELIKAALLKL
jgi:Holliday junction DNA helicase RuvA